MKLFCKNLHFSYFSPKRIVFFKGAEAPGEAESLENKQEKTSETDLDEAIQSYGQERENTLNLLTQMVQDLANPNNSQYEDYTPQEKEELANRARTAQQEIENNTPDPALLQAGIYKTDIVKDPNNPDKEIVRRGILAPADIKAEQAKFTEIILKYSGESTVAQAPAESKPAEQEVSSEAQSNSIPLEQLSATLKEQISPLDPGLHIVKDGDNTYEIFIPRPVVRQIKPAPSTNKLADQTPVQKNDLFGRY